MSEERKSRYELFLEEEERKAQPTKRCAKCKEVKLLSEFHKDRGSKLGVCSRCKVCTLVVGRNGKIFKNRIDRFWKYYWSRVQKAGDCQEWIGAYSRKYPSCSWEGKSNVMVRRLVYRLSVGVLPDDVRIVVTCRNHRCVRHSHLKAITKDEMNTIVWNTNPMGDDNGSRKYPERRPRGETVKRSKLTEDSVRIIRKRYSEDLYSQQKLADQFGVTQVCIGLIVRRKTWAHVQ